MYSIFLPVLLFLPALSSIAATGVQGSRIEVVQHRLPAELYRQRVGRDLSFPVVYGKEAIDHRIQCGVGLGQAGTEHYTQ